MMRTSLVVAACMAVGAAWLGAQEAPRSYAWYAELVSVDEAAKTITVTAKAREALNRYVGDYSAGDSLMLTWVPIEGEADTIIYAPAYEVMEGIDEGYILPAEFVSADEMAHTITVTIPVPDAVLSTVSGVEPGQWIKVTTPMHQPDEVATLTSAAATEPPDLKPPEPEQEAEPLTVETLPEGTGGPAAGTWTVNSSLGGNDVSTDCTFAQDDTDLIGVCASPNGDIEAVGTVNGNDVTFRYTLSFSGMDIIFDYKGTIDGDQMAGTVDVFGMSAEFTATRQ